jgi:hypothetical protein
MQNEKYTTLEKHTEIEWLGMRFHCRGLVKAVYKIEIELQKNKHWIKRGQKPMDTLLGVLNRQLKKGKEESVLPLTAGNGEKSSSIPLASYRIFWAK